MEKKQERGLFVRGAQSSIVIGDIKALVEAISSLLEIFQVSFISTFCTDSTLTASSSKVALL